VHGGRDEAAAEGLVDRRDFEGHGRARGFLAIPRTTSLQRRYGAP
jgi:hypothetical protein